MANFISYREWEPKVLVPSVFKGPQGQNFFAIVGGVKDYLVSMSVDSMRAAFASTATSDALPYIGNTRFIESYPADSDTTYKGRLSSSFAIWDQATSRQGMQNRLADFGLTDAIIESWRDFGSGSFAPTPYQNWWSSFWIFVPTAHGYTDDGTWGSPGYWNDSPNQQNTLLSDGVWDSDMPLSVVQSLILLIKKWKNVIEICPTVYFDPSGSLWGPTSTWGSRSWGTSGSFTIDVIHSSF